MKWQKQVRDGSTLVTEPEKLFMKPLKRCMEALKIDMEGKISCMEAQKHAQGRANQVHGNA